MKILLRKKIFLLASIVSVIFLLASKPAGNDDPVSKTPIYLNTAYTFEERAADLVSRLTLKEKESLLGNNMAAVPRLGIKAYNVWSEALHGILGFANPDVGLPAPTSFPNSVALSLIRPLKLLLITSELTILV